MEVVETGWQHFAAADWAAARDAFSAALEQEPGDPDALDGLGQSLWWLGERDAGIDRRREAYAAYQRRGDSRGAGGIAAYLAGEARIDGNDAAAAGWLARARRLLAGDERSAERGWLAVEEAKCAADANVAERHARAALEIAHALGDADVECMALAQIGQALVHQGRIDDGIAHLDEAMTVALGGESGDPLACGDACCTTLVVCDRLADLDRAAQWCEAVVDFAERRHFTPVQSWCRGIYGAVLVRAGDWERAETVLHEALQRRADRRRSGGRALPLAVLADLRLRQGRSDDAERLLTGLEEFAVATAPLVDLHLRRGESGPARALLERGAAAARDEAELLSLQADVELADGALDDAAALVDRLREIAGRLARADVAARAAYLGGRIAAGRGDDEAAAREFADAAGHYAALHYPLEEARARLALARVQAAAGSPLALAGARAARDVFTGLGAERDAGEAAALLRDLGTAGRDVVRTERGELTGREREVLRLITEGLSNNQIAERLVISPKTAEHHVSRVLAKLGVRTRGEAAAHAVREGI